MCEWYFGFDFDVGGGESVFGLFCCQGYCLVYVVVFVGGGVCQFCVQWYYFCFVLWCYVQGGVEWYVQVEVVEVGFEVGV